ncbi:MAG TPA: hypothetical protein VFQ43_13965 [Nitrososphaera sp.]|nr:hypothetical protein [Nitrososphaera sp.]
MIILDLVDPLTQSPPEVELWLAVLKRAVEDLAGHCLFEERVRVQQEGLTIRYFFFEAACHRLESRQPGQ